MKPFVVVDCRPVEDASDVNAALDRFMDDDQAALEVVGPEVIVIGTDPVLGDQERHSWKLGMQSIEDQSDPVCPDPVAERGEIGASGG
jgi:hypothetical protein